MWRRWAARIGFPSLWRRAAGNDGEFRHACVATAAAGDERDVQLVVQILAAQERGRGGDASGCRHGLPDEFAPRHWARWCHLCSKLQVVSLRGITAFQE